MDIDTKAELESANERLAQLQQSLSQVENQRQQLTAGIMGERRLIQWLDSLDKGAKPHE